MQKSNVEQNSTRAGMVVGEAKVLRRNAPLEKHGTHKLKWTKDYKSKHYPSFHALLLTLHHHYHHHHWVCILHPLPSLNHQISSLDDAMHHHGFEDVQTLDCIIACGLCW